jgi:hypothetical protein
LRAFGRVKTPAFPKRSPLAGTMDQVRPQSGKWHCDHAFVDWPTSSSMNPIRRRPRADPVQKQVPGDRMTQKGLTYRGPLQKPGFWCARKLARSVGASPAQVRRSEPPGSECCASRRRRRPRSVHSDCVGCVLSHGMGLIAGAEAVEMAERNMSKAVMQGRVVLPRSETTSRAKGSCRNLGGPAPGRHLMTPTARIGKARSCS